MTQEWPTVAIIFATFKRTEVALKTIRSLKEFLIYPNLHWHVADDGSRETDDGTDRWHVGVLTEEIAQFYPEVTYHEMDTPHGKFNPGGSINRALRAMQENGITQYMLIYDDWGLLRELDLRPHVDVLDTYTEIGFIRLSYHVPGHGFLSVGYQCPRLNMTRWMYLRMVREWSLRNPFGVSDSYLVSTQPYVAHMRFHEAYGMHPERTTPGLAEMGLSNQYANSPLGENGPQILFPIGVEVSHAPWAHWVGRAHYYAALG
jgi:hypothetical protein